MADEHQQPEGASRQAVGVLIGGLIGFAAAARMIFADYDKYADQIPWITALAMILGGCFAGLVVATLFGGASQDPPKPPAEGPKEPPAAGPP